MWAKAPHTGERWSGVGTDDGRPCAYYTSSREDWEGWKHLWQQEEALAGFLPGLLRGEVVTVVAAGDRIDGLTVPYPLAPEVGQDFTPGFIHGREGRAFGPAASVALAVTVPPCGHVILVGAQQAEVEGLRGKLVVTSLWGMFTGRRLRGGPGGAKVKTYLTSRMKSDIMIQKQMGTEVGLFSAAHRTATTEAND